MFVKRLKRLMKLPVGDGVVGRVINNMLASLFDEKVLSKQRVSICSSNTWHYG